MSDVAVTISGESNPSVTISGQINPSVTITEQKNPSVTISEQQSNSITVNAIPRATVSTEITSNDAELNALNTATGLLSTATGLLVPKSETGSFAVTGSDVTFSNLTVAGNILPDVNIAYDIGSPSKRFKDLYLSGNSIFLGESTLSFASNKLNIAAQGLTGSFIQDGQTGVFASASSLDVATGALSTATGVLDTNVSSLQTATGALSTATGNLDSKIITVSGLIVSNDTDITALNTATGLLNTATGILNTNVISLNTATGLLVQKSETGVLLTSGEIQTNIDTAVANLVDSAPGTLNTLNELAAALGDDQNFSTTTATSLGNLSTATGNLDTRVTSNDSDINSLQTATGLLNTDINTVSGLITSNDSDISALQAVTGSFAQTGSGDFGLLSVTGNISLGGNIIDTADGDILQFGTNDLIAGGKHIQAGFSVGVRGNRGNTKGMDQGSTANDLGIFCNSIEALSIQNDGDVIVNTGNLGIGTNSPDTQLHVKSAGDVSLKLEADTDNTNESHNPLMQFVQDGGLISANVGFNGNTNTEFTDAIDNAFYIENTSSAAGFGAIQFASNNEAKLTILSGGNVGIGTSNPEALLDVSSNVAGKYLRVSRGTTNVDFDFSAGSTVISSTVKPLKFGPSDEQPLILQTSGSERARIDESGNFGIGTNSPQAKLHVNGDTIISGALTGTTTISAKGNINSINGSISASEGSFTLLNGYIQDASQSNITSLGTLTSATIAGDLTVDTNTLFVNSTANNVGIGTTSPTPGKQLDVNGDIKAATIEATEINIKDADGYFIENKQFAKFENNTLKLGDHDGESFTTDIFGNGGVPMIRITGDGIQAANTFLGIGTTAPQAKLHVNGTATVSGGLTTLGKTTLSSEAFVTETGSFTLGNTHKGATVLLQNSASINITVPAQVGGYTTTFIAETHNPVSFITGAGMSGLNSFNGASDIAGIYGQAQVIYKSAEYAFLGGNVV